MHDLAADLFGRIKELYKDTDVGAHTLYETALDFLERGQPEICATILNEAVIIHGPDDSFIVEGKTSFTDVYLEVFRRAFLNVDEIRESTPGIHDAEIRRSMHVTIQYLTEAFQRNLK